MGRLWVGFSPNPLPDPKPLGSKNVNRLPAPKPFMRTHNFPERVGSGSKNPWTRTHWHPCECPPLASGRTSMTLSDLDRSRCFKSGTNWRKKSRKQVLVVGEDVIIEDCDAGQVEKGASRWLVGWCCWRDVFRIKIDSCVREREGNEISFFFFNSKNQNIKWIFPNAALS